VKFLANSVRADGSLPIDTNLATWVTTLSINALAAGGEDVAALLGEKCLDWLLSCQHTQRHPFTGADPGGWGWSDLGGAVPDADDTAGAMLAPAAWRLASCNDSDRERSILCKAGFDWILTSNADGGGTFCRGWKIAV
jgi:squalene-hopene/tetraprenyl-beta-curcumene cyclase